MRHRRPRRFVAPLVIVISLLLAVFGAIGIWQYAQDRMEDRPSFSPLEASRANSPSLVTPSASDVTSSDAASSSTQSPSCGAGQSFQPATVQVLGRSVSSMPLSPHEREADGSIYTEPPAPPFSEPGSFAYDTVSALAGSSSGLTILTAHSFSASASLGNDLRASLGVGDEIRLLGESGEEACYQVTSLPEVDREDFPPDLYEPARSHQLVIIVCSDYRDGEWRKRTIWYADPIS